MDKKIKISELVKRTGVPKSTILYYVKMGLLPEPVKTSPNMAYYDESCVERIQMIKELQSRKFLPLEHIKWILEKRDVADHPVQVLAEVYNINLGVRRIEGRRYSREELLNKAEMTSEMLDRLEKMEMIIPLDSESRPYDDDDVTQCRMIKNMIDKGIQPDRVGYYPEYIRKIVEEDMKIHEEVTHPLFETDHTLFINTTDMMLDAAIKAREYLFKRFFRKLLYKHLKDAYPIKPDDKKIGEER